jgi:SGNH hydrolase-like domain, acetyltransferase AlgX
VPLVRNAHAQLRTLLYPLVPSYCPYFDIVRAGPHRDQKVLFAPFRERPSQTLRDAVRVTRAHEVKLLLVYVPIKFRVYRDFVDPPPGSKVHHWTLWPLPDLFAHFCLTEEFACLDLTGVLRDTVRAGGMPHAPADSHWSPEGHQLIARQLEVTLASLGWLHPGISWGPPAS